MRSEPRSANPLVRGVLALLLAIGAAISLAMLAPTSVRADQWENTATGYVRNAFDKGLADDVNLFNGNLVMTVPLGSFQVDGPLAYSLALSYNSKVWRTIPFQTFEPTLTGQKEHISQFQVAEDGAPLGIGWALRLGQIYFDSTETIEEHTLPLIRSAGGTSYFYVDSSGAMHRLYHARGASAPVPGPSGDAFRTAHFFTRDGSGLRITAFSADRTPGLVNGAGCPADPAYSRSYLVPCSTDSLLFWRVEFGDGVIHELGHRVVGWDVPWDYRRSQVAPRPIPDMRSHLDGWYASAMYYLGRREAAGQEFPDRVSITYWDAVPPVAADCATACFRFTPACIAAGNCEELSWCVSANCPQFSPPSASVARWPGVIKEVRDYHRTQPSQVISTTLTGEGLLGSISLPLAPATSSAARATFTFEYEWLVTRRPVTSTTSNSPMSELDLEVVLPYLVSIGLPDGSSQRYGYYTSPKQKVPQPNPCVSDAVLYPTSALTANQGWNATSSTGVVSAVQLPTGGIVAYEYGDFRMDEAAVSLARQKIGIWAMQAAPPSDKESAQPSVYIGGGAGVSMQVETGIVNRTEYRCVLDATTLGEQSLSTTTSFERLISPTTTENNRPIPMMVVVASSTGTDPTYDKPKQRLHYFGTRTISHPLLCLDPTPSGGCRTQYGREFLREEFSEPFSDGAAVVAYLKKFQTNVIERPPDYSFPATLLRRSIVHRSFVVANGPTVSVSAANPDIRLSADTDIPPDRSELVSDSRTQWMRGSQANESLVGWELRESGSDFDGWARWKTTTTSAIGGALVPPDAAATRASTRQLIAPSESLTASPWLTGLLTETWQNVTSRGRLSSIHTLYSFDAVGFLTEKRIELEKVDPADPAALVVAFDDLDPVTGKRYGNVQGRTTAYADTLDGLMRKEDRFRQALTYRCGVLASSRFEDAIFFSERRTIDCGSGVATEVYDVSNVMTTIRFDQLGRPSVVTPQDSSEAFTRIRYQTESASNAPNAALIERVAPSSGDVLERTILGYDSFGRMWAMYRDLPGGSGAMQLLNIGSDGVAWRTSMWERALPAAANAGIPVPSAFGLDLRSCGQVGGGIGSFPAACLERDALGRTLRVTNADGSQVSTKWDAGFRSEVTRDVSGSPQVTEYETDPLGQLTRIVEPHGLETVYGWDVTGQVYSVQQTSSSGGSVLTQLRTFAYNPAGWQLSESVPERQNVPVSYEYDALGNLLKTRFQANLLRSSTFDLAGRIQSSTWTSADGSIGTAAFSYGTSGLGLGKLVQSTSQNTFGTVGIAPVTVRQTFGYQGCLGGRLCTRSQELTGGGGYFDTSEREWSYTYSPLGNVSGIRYPAVAGASGIRTFVKLEQEQGLDRRIEIARSTADPLAGGNSSAFAILAETVASSQGELYWPTGSIGGMQISYDLPATSGALLVDFTRDASGIPRPGGIGINRCAAAECGYFTPLKVLGPYEYDGSGNILWIGAGSHSSDSQGGNNLGDIFSYDSISRLISADLRTGDAESYSYDGFGNLQGRTRTQPGLSASTSMAIPTNSQTNRLVSASDVAGGFPISYDGRGNVTAWGGTELFVDGLDRTTRSTLADGTHWLYAYDAGGERVGRARVVGGVGEFSAIDCRDGRNRVFSKWESAAGSPGPSALLAKEYFHFGPHMIATRETCAGDPPSLGWKYFAADHLGTPRVVVSGTEATYQDLLPYGEEVSSAGAVLEEQKFTGHERDSETGLDYMHARYYNGAAGRFLSVDKAGGNPDAPQSWNRYAYALGNPIRFWDPDGLAARGDVVFFNWAKGRPEDWPRHSAIVTQVDKAGTPTKAFGAWGDTMTFHEVDLTTYQAGDRTAQKSIIGTGSLAGLTEKTVEATISSWQGDAVAADWNGANGPVCVDVVTSPDGYGGDPLRAAMAADFKANPGSYTKTPLDNGKTAAPDPKSEDFYRSNIWLRDFLESTGRYTDSLPK